MKFAGLALFCSLLLISFQNCSGLGGFQLPSQTSLDLGSLSTTGSGTPTPTPTPLGTPVPGPTPTATPLPPGPAGELKKTYFYFGRVSGMDVLVLDHGSGQVTLLPAVSFSGRMVGWLNYEKTSGEVLASDITQANLQIYNFKSDTGALNSVRSLGSFASAVVHLTLVPGMSGWDLFTSSYDRSVLDYYHLSQDQTQLTRQQTVSFGAGAKTHSSAFDSKRNLLYVANLGLDKISVYQVMATGLQPLTTISVLDPRTLVYDARYDKLFVATEAYTGNSYIRIFEIAGNAGAYTFSEVGSLAMPLVGGDLKVNHKMGYAMATVRESGKEAVVGLPLTPQGLVDKNRASFSVRVDQKTPRALEVTEDGEYMAVGMNSVSAENLVVYKLVFDSQANFVSSQKLFQKKVDGNQGYACGLSIPVY